MSTALEGSWSVGLECGVEGLDRSITRVYLVRARSDVSRFSVNSCRQVYAWRGIQKQPSMRVYLSLSIKHKLIDTSNKL
jgi:hypothetical protein